MKNEINLFVEGIKVSNFNNNGMESHYHYYETEGIPFCFDGTDRFHSMCPDVTVHHARIYPFYIVDNNITYRRNIAFHHSVEKQLGIMGKDFLQANNELYNANVAVNKELDKQINKLGVMRQNVYRLKAMSFLKRLIFLFRGGNMDFTGIIEKEW